jgi:coenzyme F420-dependent glucose-6-phosphate dehydrogenase
LPTTQRSLGCFEQLVEDREADDIEGTIPLGPDVEEYLEQLGEYDKAGYTHVCVHQIGSDQKGFLEFAERELIPKL